jgi:hypothetical protein
MWHLLTKNQIHLANGMLTCGNNLNYLNYFLIISTCGMLPHVI